MQADPIVALYRGWNSYEQSVREDGVYAIDFDLIPARYEDTITSRWEVLSKLVEYRDSILEDSLENIYIKAKLNSSIHYLEAVMGENLPFEQYILNTMGILPHLFTNNLIEDLHDEIDDRLSQWSLRYKSEYFEEFYTKFRITQFRKLEQDIIEEVKHWHSVLSGIIDLPSMPTVDFQFVNKNENWDTWIYGLEHNHIGLDINMNEAVQYAFLQCTPTLLASHELCGHALHMATLAREIKKGAIHPVSGLVLVHSVEMFQAEGLGHTIPDYVPGIQVDALSDVYRKIITHRNQVLNNAYIFLAEGDSVRSVYKFVTEHLPFYSSRYLELELKQWNRDPSMKAYRYIQGQAEDFFRHTARKLSDEQRVRFLRQMFTRPMTHEQIKSYIRNLMLSSDSEGSLVEENN